jgi:hypothetical protein
MWMGAISLSPAKRFSTSSNLRVESKFEPIRKTRLRLPSRLEAGALSFASDSNAAHSRQATPGIAKTFSTMRTRTAFYSSRDRRGDPTYERRFY